MTRLVPARAGALACTVIVVAAAVVEYLRTGSPVEAGEAAIAGAIAVAVGWLALTLPGSTPRGAVIGGSLVVAGILTWTSTSRPIVIWAALAAAGVACAVWSRPWSAGLTALPRMGAAWMSLAYWPLGVVGALLVGHLSVGVQRIAYAGVFTLIAIALIAVVRSTGRDPSVGVAAAIGVGVAALLLAGSGSVFDGVHEIPANNESAQLMRDRFWGGLGLFYHPNSLAGLGVVAAIRIGIDRAFTTRQRVAVIGVAGLLLVLSNSRTGLVFALVAAVIHGVLAIRACRPDLPVYRRTWLAVLTPFVLLALVLVLSGGTGYLVRNRLATPAPDTTVTTRIDTVSSGRVDTWRQVAIDWENAGLAEKLFGDTTTSRAVVIRTNDGAPPEGPRRQLNTDNAAVGAFRRGGVLGALTFLLGAVLLTVHALRRRRDGTPPAAWFTVAAVALLPTIATEDWMLGGTNGAILLLLLAGEAFLVKRPHEPHDGGPIPIPAPAPEFDFASEGALADQVSANPPSAFDR